MFEKSGQTVSEFCRVNDLPPATLSLWRQQQTAACTANEGGELVEIESSAVLAATGPKPLVTIRVRGDIAIEVVAETDPKWLGALVMQLAAARA